MKFSLQFIVDETSIWAKQLLNGENAIVNSFPDQNNSFPSTYIDIIMYAF